MYWCYQSISLQDYVCCILIPSDKEHIINKNVSEIGRYVTVASNTVIGHLFTLRRRHIDRHCQ